MKSMHQLASQHQDGPELLARFAGQAGAADYRGGPFGFALDDGPAIVAEPLADGQAVGLTVDLQHAPEDSRLEEFLAANLRAHVQESGMYAYLPAENSLLFFRRLEQVGRTPFEDLVSQIRAFAQEAQAALLALPEPLPAGETVPSGAAPASDADVFGHVWSDFLLAQGLGREAPQPEEDGSFVLALEGAGHVFVCPDPLRACVVLKTSLALLPLDVHDEADALRTLLHAHTLGEATGGAVFAIDAGAQELVAWRALALAGLDAFALNDAIDSLAEVARFYSEKLAMPAVAA